jgi:trk system potassium uptake protein TrkH
MILGQTNFMLHLNFFSGRFRKYFNHCETKFFAVLLVIFASLMTFNLLETGYAENLLDSIRISLFQFVTCITTTGFISVGDLRILPPGFIAIMVLMMLVGGDQESTGGGIKQYRVIVALKGIYYSIRESILNPRVITSHNITRMGEKYNLPNEEIRLTSSYILFYLLLFLLGSTVFTLYGYSLQDSMFEFSSAISTVGLSVGITNYNANPVILWTAIIGMFLGRMEIIVVFKAIFRVEKDLKNREYLR